MVLVVEVGDGLTEGLDAGSRAIFAATDRDVNVVGALKAALDLVVDFGSTLTQVGPRLGVFEVALLVGALRGPNDTGGGSGSVKTSVNLVAGVVVAELAMDLRVDLCGFWLAGQKKEEELAKQLRRGSPKNAGTGWTGLARDSSKNGNRNNIPDSVLVVEKRRSRPKLVDCLRWWDVILADD